MIVNECFRRYFDFAQYDKMGIFTRAVKMTFFDFEKSSKIMKER
jgi:hypothetical protein